MKNWKKTLLPPSATIKQAISCLNRSATQIILINDLKGRLLGTLSDGDIRRALLKGFTLNNKIFNICNTNPFVITQGLEKNLVLDLMSANKITQIPIVDKKRKIIGLFLWDEIVSKPNRHNLFVVMAGGFGTRLRPFTNSCPKPMISVSGRPILQHIIERAKNEGFNRFAIAIYYLGKKIENYFESGDKFGVKIEYLKEKNPLGTAGALKLIKPTPNAPFIVTNGDVIADIRYGDMIDFHIKHHAIGTMAVRAHEFKHPFGVVHTNGLEIIGFEEKPVHRSHINAGVYALSPKALKVLKPGEPLDMPTLFQRLQAQSKKVIAYPMHEPWLDVGQPGDLIAANSLKPGQ